jgi:hypothetical protein
MADLTVENLFSICNYNEYAENVTYFIQKENLGNSMLIICTNDLNQILSYSNEWLYLISAYYPTNPTYNFITDRYNSLIKNEYNEIIITEKVIPFITSFSTGTVHGYIGFFSIIMGYLENKDKFKNHKILVYKNSQTGLLQILNHLCSLNIIEKEKIILIDPDIKYKINNIHFIKSRGHIFTNDDLTYNISRFIENTWKPDENYNANKICIMKTESSENLTHSGIIKTQTAVSFCKKFNLDMLNPGDINENDLIVSLLSCKLFVVTWGTAFFKNIVYLSEKCECIIVLVIGDDFINQYNHLSKFYKFKNAKVVYKIVSEDLSDLGEEVINALQ